MKDLIRLYFVTKLCKKVCRFPNLFGYCDLLVYYLDRNRMMIEISYLLAANILLQKF